MVSRKKTALIFISMVYYGPVNSGDEYKVDKATISNGGETISGANYQIKGSIGQSDASKEITGSSFGINGGIWTKSFNNDIIFKNGFEG